MINKFLKFLRGNSLKAQLVRGAGGTAILKTINMVLVVLTSILMARNLGPENYGIYAFVLSLITLLALPTHAGLPTLIIRETARNQLNKKWGLLRGLLKLSNSFVWVYSLLVALAAAVFVFWFWQDSESMKVSTFLWSLLLLPLVAFEGIRTSTLRGLRWVVSSQLPEQVVSPLVTVCILAIVLLLGKSIDAVAAIQIHAFSVFTAFCLGLVLLIKALPEEVKKAEPEYSIRPWAASLLPLSIFSGLYMLDSQISIIFLGFLATSEEVGLFHVASTGATLVIFGLSAVNMALAPQIARLYAAGELKKLQEIITLSTRAIAAVSFPVSFVFIIWGKDLISIIFGEEYTDASLALAILCAGQLINASMGSVGLVLNMTGNDKRTLLGIIAAVFSNLICALVLIPKFGLTGAAIAYSISLTVWNVVLFYQAKKYTGINTFLFRRS